MDRGSVLRKLQLASKYLLALLTPDISVRCPHVILHLSDVLKDGVTGETVRGRVAYDSMDESRVLVVKPVVAVLAFRCSSNAPLFLPLFSSSSSSSIVAIADHLDLDGDLSDHRPLSFLQFHNGLEDVALGARALLVLLEQVAALADLVQVG